MFNSAKSTLTDRKFWTGLVLGTFMAGTLAVLQPLNAAPAPAAPASEASLKLIAGAMAKMMQSQQKMADDVASVKASAMSMDSSLKALKEASTFNQPQPR